MQKQKTSNSGFFQDLGYYRKSVYSAPLFIKVITYIQYKKTIDEMC